MATEEATAQDRILSFMAKHSYLPLRKRALAKKMNISMDDYVDFRQLIDVMVTRGTITQLKRGKYGLPRTTRSIEEELPASTKKNRKGRKQKNEPYNDTDSAKGKDLPRDAIIGRVDIKKGGFGFLLSDPPGNDLYISREDLGGAMQGDLVAAVQKRRPHGRNQRCGRNKNARVARIMERARTLIVGTFYLRKNAAFDFPGRPVGFITPDARGLFDDIDILEADQGEAKEGDKVAIELIEADDSKRGSRRPSGRIVQVFGEAGQAEAEIEAIIQNFELRTEFPEEVLKQAEQIPTEFPEEELAQRIDYTSPLTFTIDPKDAKDHDDAVALRELSDGCTELLVHIADVAHFIPTGSPIDVEARERGTSVYIPGKVYPMLPEKLSNNICSLKEGQLRLTNTARITFSKSLDVVKVQIERSYIRSAAFLKYDQVKKAVDDEDPTQVPSLEIYESLCRMKTFAAKLRKKRLKKGSIDLDLPEVKILFDENGAISGYEKEESHWAHQLIEDMMLAANKAVAEYLIQNEILGLYRIHEEPDPEKLERFAEFVTEFGVKVKKPFTRDSIISVLDQVRDKDYRHTIHLALLTSLKQATYAADCMPHFALNFMRYLHYTSPIRRYPDLIVHRALSQRFPPGEAALPISGKKRKGGLDTPKHHEDLGEMRTLAKHCSERERNAEKAEREVKKFRQIQYLENNERQSHPGIITGVRNFGLFVELQDCYVEGLVRIEDLADDYYHFYPDQHLLQGRRKKRSFQLGDKVTVRVAHIDAGQKKVSLIIV